MAEYSSKRFQHMPMNLDGNTYDECDFVDCELSLGGLGPAPVFHRCTLLEGTRLKLNTPTSDPGDTVPTDRRRVIDAIDGLGVNETGTLVHVQVELGDFGVEQIGISPGLIDALCAVLQRGKDIARQILSRRSAGQVPTISYWTASGPGTTAQALAGNIYLMLQTKPGIECNILMSREEAAETIRNLQAAIRSDVIRAPLN